MGAIRDDARPRSTRGALTGVAVGAAIMVVAGWGLAFWAVVARPWEGPSGWPLTEHSAWVAVWAPAAPAEDGGAGPTDAVSTAEWDALVGEVRAVDADAFIMTVAPTRFADSGGLMLLHAVDGPLPPDALVEGRAPGRGEAVVPVTYRDEHGWSVGDRRALAPGDDDASAPYAALTIVGFSTEETPGFASWDDAEALGEAYAPVRVDGTVLTDRWVWWDGEVPGALEPHLVD